MKLLLLILVSLKCEKRLFKLWKVSNLCRNIFNGKIQISNDLINKIKFTTDLDLKKNDLSNFENLLQNTTNFNMTIYKGLYNNDPLYNNLKNDKIILTNEYLSFFKKKEKALLNGQKILLSLKTPNNHDISEYLDEEILLKKNLLLQVINSFYINDIFYIELVEIKK